MNYLCIIAIIAIIVIVIFIIVFYRNRNKMDQCFYDVTLFPELNGITKYENEIVDEIGKLNDSWIDWPEKKLYEQNSNNWTVYPLFAFGSWANKNCNNLPVLTQYLKSIPNLKVALLSKLNAKTKLKEHRGWGKYSNNVLRCHFGIKVPKQCYMAVKPNDRVEYEIKQHENKKWLIFDDSKYHYANNESEEERIVLIIDLIRPNFVKKGTSNVEYSHEFVNLIDEFKKSNLTVQPQ